MAKTNSTTNLKTKTSRKKLPPYREPHWVKYPVEAMKGASLGFRRSPETGTETWHGRLYLDGCYYKTNLGTVTPAFDYREAYKAALDWAQKLKEAGPVVAEEKTLEDVTDEYLTHLQGNSDERLIKKRRQAAKRLDALIPPALYRRKVNELKPSDITKLQRDYSQRKTRNPKPELGPDDPKLVPISPDAVNRVMTHLIAALNHGYKQGDVATRDAWKHYARLPEAKVKRRSKEYIPATERNAFLKCCPANLRAFATAMNMTAARPSELRRMRVSDVNLNDGTVRLITFKGGNGGSVRYFPIPEGSAVRALFESQCEGKRPDDFVFKSQYGKQWTQANLAKKHNSVRDDKDKPHSKAFETYVWRHCRITDWASQFPAPEVAAMAGTSLDFIQKNYFKTNADIRAAMAEM